MPRIQCNTFSPKLIQSMCKRYTNLRASNAVFSAYIYLWITALFNIFSNHQPNVFWHYTLILQSTESSVISDRGGELQAQFNVSFSLFSRGWDTNILKISLLYLWIFINANSIDFRTQFSSQFERFETVLKNAFLFGTQQ